MRDEPMGLQLEVSSVEAELAEDLAFLECVAGNEDLGALLALARHAATEGVPFRAAVAGLADVIRQQGFVALEALLRIARTTM